MENMDGRLEKRKANKMIGNGRHRRFAILAFLSAVLIFFAILFPLCGTASASINSPYDGRSGNGFMTASFPALAPGDAWLSKHGISMTFDCVDADAVISLGGKALLLPVKAGIDNQGMLSVLFDSTLSVSAAGKDHLRLLWKRQVPTEGRRVLVGEAVLSMAREPQDGAMLARRMEKIPVPAVSPRTTEPGITTSRAALSLAAGYIVRIPLWVVNLDGHALSFSLGTAMVPLSGKPSAVTVKETLRYVSSDVLLPKEYRPVLQWTGNLLCLKPGEAFQFYLEVIPALRAMLLEAERQGVSGFDLDNSYRSSAWQRKLFDRRLALSELDATIQNPLASTLRRVARPNGSEHQTGLAFDMYAKTGYGNNFGKTINAQWLEKQAWKYGFVIRYPEKGEDMTKVMYEPWHVRYLGRPMAGYLTRERIPYEGFAVDALNGGAVWLGESEAESEVQIEAESKAESKAESDVGTDVIWLAILATPSAGYASGLNGLAPEVSEFLPDRRIWLIPMGSAVRRSPSGGTIAKAALSGL